ncbi:MAG TPA: ABC transporter permease [Pyrinomonadaceae bacterium]|nr:ABC transporter permease [Pyrinomonadaceae bacterium]
MADEGKSQWVRLVRARLAPLGLEGPREAEIVEELAEHLEDAYEESLALGRTEEEARGDALAQFQDWRLLECEVSRAERSAFDGLLARAGVDSEKRGGGANMLELIIKDLRYALRMLRRKPGFTAVAVLTLALGIGGNTAIFSVVNAVLLRALPYPEADRLVSVYETLPQGGTGGVSTPNYLDWRAQSDAFTGLAAYQFGDFNLQEEQQPVRAVGATVTANFFDVLGVTPQHGRAFLEGEDKMGRDRVVVLSDRLWRRNYGADPGVVGQDILLGGEKYQVVGVMPPTVQYPMATAELWVPLVFSDRQLASRGSHWLIVMGRLKPGVSFEQAQEQMSTIGRVLEQQYPGPQEGRNVALRRVEEEAVQGVRPALLMLLGAVGFVLLIACTNVANLLLARAAARRKEVAIRSALGAGRWRLMRQFLTESVVLALLGGAAGLLVARWTLQALTSLAAGYHSRMSDVALDWRVLGFTGALSVLTGVVAGLVPAFHVSRADVQETLKESGNAGSSARGTWLRSGLAVAEVAAALVLLVGAGLLVKSFLRLQQVETGLRPEGVLTMRVSLPASRYDTPEKSSLFYREVLERVSALPGVEAAGIINMLPIQQFGNNGEIQVEGREPLPLGRVPLTENRRASSGYFKALGIPLLAGRLFEPGDETSGAVKVVVSRELVRTFFPDGDALGKRIRWSGGSEWWTIVGVVGDVKQSGLTQPSRPELYFPYTVGSGGMTLVVRGAADDPAEMTAAVRREVQAVDPNQPVYNVLTMEEVINRSTVNFRLNMTLLTIFAGLATLLAVVGIYSVMSYLVTQHTREIGIRMALGAQPGNILKLVLGQGLALTLVGVGVGALLAFGLTQLIPRFLYEVGGTDPLTYVSVSLLLTVVALVACYIPARRATKVDPLVALRYE